jgi:D-alanine-D-alanine ligase
MSDLGRVLVLAGGLSHERDVSLRSGRRVAEALRSVGVEVEQRDVDASLVDRLRNDPPDAIFPVLHGVTGEDGALRQVLDLYGVPYVGADAAACRTAFDKPVASTMVGTAGLHTPQSIVLGHDTFRELGAAALMEAVVAQIGLPLVVKPARGGSALGASIVRAVEDLPSAMVNSYAYGPVALIERYIVGTEVAVTVVDTGDGPRPLPAVEIHPDSGFYDYEARYTAGATQFIVPARLGPAVAQACADAAITAHKALGLRDLSRSDLVVDASGVPWFLEVNVAPGMTETSLVPIAAEAAGIELGVLCRDLLAAAAAR